jgi:hypothetical protein
VVNFLTLNSEFQFWNAVDHFSNSIFLLFEFANNNIDASMESYK